MSEGDAELSVTGGSDKLLTTEQDSELIDSEKTPCLSPTPVDSETITMKDASCVQTSCEIGCDSATSAQNPQSNCDCSGPAADLLAPSGEQTLLFRRRWLIVFLFASYSMANAYQWIHLNIIFDKVCPNCYC